MSNTKKKPVAAPPNLADKYSEMILGKLPPKQAMLHRERIVDICRLFEIEAQVDAKKGSYADIERFFKEGSVNTVKFIWELAHMRFSKFTCSTIWNDIGIRDEILDSFTHLMSFESMQLYEILCRYFESLKTEPDVQTETSSTEPASEAGNT